MSSFEKEWQEQLQFFKEDLIHPVVDSLDLNFVMKNLVFFALHLLSLYKAEKFRVGHVGWSSFSYCYKKLIPESFNIQSWKLLFYVFNTIL